MTFYNLISSLLSYVFTFIIYLFILGIIRLIYLDVKKMSRFEDDAVNASNSHTASLRSLSGQPQLTNPLKKRYPIYDSAIIGRGKDCDIILKEKFVSTQHLKIWFEKGEWYLEDLGSRNGTRVNDQRIARRIILDPQDEISVGGIRFVFEL